MLVVPVLAGLAFIIGAGSAHAEMRYRVVLLRPPVTDDVSTDALARVRGELTAAGFEISMQPQDPGLDVRTALETGGFAGTVYEGPFRTHGARVWRERLGAGARSCGDRRARGAGSYRS